MKTITDLRKFVAPEIITGVDARLLVGRYITHFAAKNPMIVTDSNLRSLPWFLDILDEIKRYVFNFVIFDHVTSNPRDYEVMEGAALFHSKKCDLIIAIGGGSPIDCAKGISIVSTNGGSILDYEGVDVINLPGPPLICIPTTSGASADVSQFSIIRDSENKVKKAIISKKVVPDLALIDPVPLMTMDFYLTACTGMDALTHAIEAYVSNANSNLSNVHALEAIRLISTSLEQGIQPDRTLQVMFQLMMGSLQAGLAFSNASLGAVHAMAHSLGGQLDLPHGECNSILLEHIIDMNYEAATELYTDIAKQLGIDTEQLTDSQIKEALLNRIRSLRKNLGINDFARIDSLNDNILEKLTEGALADPCLITNPRELTKEEIRGIYERVLQQQK
jgi:alcohol dehydrogenase class IV